MAPSDPRCVTRAASFLFSSPDVYVWPGLQKRTRSSFAPRHVGAVSSRRGVILLVVLVCLAVAAGVFVVLVKQVAAQRHWLQTSQWGVQAQWLAEAGVERAVARLAANADYAGETWNIPAGELAGGQAAVVRIRTETIADQPGRRTIRVEADYPDDAQRRCRKVKQIVAEIIKK